MLTPGAMVVYAPLDERLQRVPPAIYVVISTNPCDPPFEALNLLSYDGRTRWPVMATAAWWRERTVPT